MPQDRIHIRDLALRCIIGINPEERREKQDVTINIVMECDLSKAAMSDSLEDTVNYREVKKEIIAMVEASDCYLIERLADEIAEICLQSPLVKGVWVTVDKPGPLRFARSAAVEIYRRN